MRGEYKDLQKEEYDFKAMCKLTTNYLNLEEDSLSSNSRKRPLQMARSVVSVIARKEADIHRNVIANVLKRDRTTINYYEDVHKKRYQKSELYRNTFNKIYKAYKDIDSAKKIFIDKDYMKSFLLQNGVRESLIKEVIIVVKSGKVKCNIKSSYFDFSNQMDMIKLVLRDYHYSIKIN